MTKMFKQDGLRRSPPLRSAKTALNRVIARYEESLTAAAARRSLGDLNKREPEPLESGK